VNTPATQAMPKPAATNAELLAALQAAVTQALDRKRRLGQYAVVWQNNGPVTFGEDAPAFAPARLAAEPSPPVYDTTRPLGDATD